MARTLGVILAGGRGRRLLLEIPKARVRVGGMTLLERARKTLQHLCDEIVVTAPPGLELGMNGSGVVEDVPGAEGPLAGLVAGLNARAYEQALALGVDFPLMRAGTLKMLVDRLAGQAAVVPAPGGVPQPLAAAYGPSAAAALKLRLAAGERSVTRAVLTLSPLLVDDRELSNWEGGVESFLNLNTPDQCAEAESALGSLEAREP